MRVITAGAVHKTGGRISPPRHRQNSIRFGAPVFSLQGDSGARLEDLNPVRLEQPPYRSRPRSISIQRSLLRVQFEQSQALKNCNMTPQEILNLLSDEPTNTAANEKNVHWAKMRGHPIWPCQKLSEQAAQMFLSESEKIGKIPIIFFGEKQVAWVSTKTAFAWPAGSKQAHKMLQKDVEKGCKPQSGTRGKLYEALEQVLAYLLKNERPKGWWESINDSDDSSISSESITEDTDDAVDTQNSNAQSSQPPKRRRKGTTSTLKGVTKRRRRKGQVASDSGKNNACGSSATDTSGGSDEAETSKRNAEILAAERLNRRLNEFETITCSVWRTRQGRRKLLPISEVETCICERGDGTNATNCSTNCILKHTQIRCDPRTCPCGDLCQNKQFEETPIAGIEAFMTIDGRGIGIKANRPIYAHDYVIEYVGEVIDYNLLMKRFEKARKGPGKYMDYYMQLEGRLWLDARNKGNLSRFINSSCMPNCRAERFRDAATGQQRIAIIANRDIRVGEELTYDYFMWPIHEGGYSKHLDCTCGAPNCRGSTLAAQKNGVKASSGGNAKKRKRAQQQENATSSGSTHKKLKSGRSKKRVKRSKKSKEDVCEPPQSSPQNSRVRQQSTEPTVVLDTETDKMDCDAVNGGEEAGEKVEMGAVLIETRAGNLPSDAVSDPDPLVRLTN